MDNLKFYNSVRVVPEEAKTPITGGRLKGKTDINPMWRLKALTEQFGPCGIGWYYEVTKQWTETSGNEIAAFVNINLFVKVNNEWSMPIFGNGGSMLVASEKNGLYLSDEAYKMATTDAISVACKQLGFGADVYWQKDKTKYSTKEEAKEEVKEKPKPNPKLDEIRAELERTGYTEAAVFSKYKVDSLEKLSALQINDFLTKIKAVPNKES